MPFQQYIQRFITFIYIICIASARRICDVRVWYLNIITDDVFNVDLTEEQRTLKHSIELLVLKSAESRDTRMQDCTVLYMYNDMLKELFNYSPSGSGMPLKEIEMEEQLQSDEKDSDDDKREIDVEHVMLDGVNERELDNVKHEYVTGEGSAVETTDRLTEHYRTTNGDQQSIPVRITEDTSINEALVEREEIKDPETAENTIEAVFADRTNDSPDREQTKTELLNHDYTTDTITQDAGNLVDGNSNSELSGKHTKDNSDNYGHIEHSSVECTYHLSTSEIVDNVGHTVDTTDETELLDDLDIEQPSDYSITTLQDNNDFIYKYNSTDSQISEEVFVTSSIPFGVCWSFGCLKSDIFDVYSTEGMNNMYQSNEWHRKGKDNKYHAIERSNENVVFDNMDEIVSGKKGKLKCYIGPFCTTQCYYLFLMSKSFCMVDFPQNCSYLTRDNIMTKDNFNKRLLVQEQGRTYTSHHLNSDQNINTKSTTDTEEQSSENIVNANVHSQVNVETVATESFSKVTGNVADPARDTEGIFLSSNVISYSSSEVYDQRKMSISQFENIVEQKTIHYYSKLQTLEMMIIKLENKLLLEALNKQNHSSTISKLENKLLKLENELLKLRKTYQNLIKDADSLHNRQHKYLELAYKQQIRKNRPELSHQSDGKHEIISKHQEKINELADVLCNQSVVIIKLKDKQNTLEEQNAMLHQMVMNQTIFMTSIIKTVQDLTEQSIRNQKEIDSLQQKAGATYDGTIIAGKTTKSGVDITMEERDVIDQLDTVLFNNKNQKGQSVYRDSFENIDIYSENSALTADSHLNSYSATEAPAYITKTCCPKDNKTCPSCYYNSVVYSTYIPFQNRVWSTCKSIHLHGRSDETHSDSDYPNSPIVADAQIDEEAKNDRKTSTEPCLTELHLLVSVSSRQNENDEEMEHNKFEDISDQEKVLDIEDNTKYTKETADFKRYKIEGYTMDSTREEYLKKEKYVEKSSEEVHEENAQSHTSKEDMNINNKQSTVKTEIVTDKGLHNTENIKLTEDHPERQGNYVNSEDVENYNNKLVKLGDSSNVHEKNMNKGLPSKDSTSTINEHPVKPTGTTPSEKDDSLQNKEVKHTAYINVNEGRNTNERNLHNIIKDEKETIKASTKEHNITQKHIDIETDKKQNIPGGIKSIDIDKEQTIPTDAETIVNGNDKSILGEIKGKFNGKEKLKPGDVNRINIDNRTTVSGKEQLIANEYQHTVHAKEKHIHNVVNDNDRSIEKHIPHQAMVLEHNKENQISGKINVLNSDKEKHIPNQVKDIDSSNENLIPDVQSHSFSDHKKNTENKLPTVKHEKLTKAESKHKEKKLPINLLKNKQSEPKDCYDYYSRGERKDGLFKVKPVGSDKMIEVFCDMRRGGWTVIHRRQDGSTNFFQGWEDYKKGFGGLYGEHWLGNDNIHLLTNQDFYKLHVDLMDWQRTKKFAEFDNFLIENLDEGYRLHIDGYSGDAGDGLTKHDGNKFSTKDVDNDRVVKEFGGSCANRFSGAGWYYKCYASNLNGKFYKGGKIPEKRFDGVTWKPWTGPNYSLKKVEMKIRPASAKS